MLSHERSTGNQAVVRELQFVIAVSSFAKLLKGGKYTGTMTYQEVLELTDENKGENRFGYRSEFVDSVRTGKTIAHVK